MWSFISLLFTSIIVCYLYVKKKYSFWKERGLPYEEPLFPFGNFYASSRKIHMTTRLQTFYKNGKKTGFPAYGLYLFLTPIIFAIDLDFIRTILIKDFKYFMDRGSYYNERDDPLSAHLFNLKGSKWKILRPKLTAAFSAGKMKSMISTMNVVVDELKKCVDKMIEENNEIEINELFGRYTTDMIGSCAFGIDCNSLKDPNAEFREMGRKVFKEPKLTVITRTLTTIFPKIALFFRCRNFQKDVTDFFKNIVEETIEYREKKNVSRNDFVDLLIQLKNHGVLTDDPINKIGKLTINEIAAQAFIFFLAGFETSSTSLTYVFYELCQSFNQRIQEKARKEIETVLEKHNGQLTYDALNEMHYLEMILNESLRKYPPAVIVVRGCTEDYVYDGKYHIPNGTLIIVPVYPIHYDPEYYPNPNVFDPDRFLPEQIAKRPSHTFLPFGDGPRNCIGMRFGMIEMKMALAMILKNFKLSTCERTEPMPLTFNHSKFVLSPKNDIRIRFERV